MSLVWGCGDCAARNEAKLLLLWTALSTERSKVAPSYSSVSAAPSASWLYLSGGTSYWRLAIVSPAPGGAHESARSELGRRAAAAKMEPQILRRAARPAMSAALRAWRPVPWALCATYLLCCWTVRWPSRTRERPVAVARSPTALAPGRRRSAGSRAS
eukprot:scaffold2215_cov353-Prasinococcus_capsulatus_cf.AAC.7